MLSPALLTPESSAVVIVDYQEHVLEGIKSGDRELIELNAQALARVSRIFEVPTVFSTIGVELRGDQPTLAAIRDEVPEAPEYDRTTMNAWEDETVREAVIGTGRRRLIFAGVWTEVCLLYPVLHAQSEGFETYFVVDAVGGSSAVSHEVAIQRMIQAGSRPITLNSLVTEWVRDWKLSPYAEAVFPYFEWYAPRVERILERLEGASELVGAS